MVEVAGGGTWERWMRKVDGERSRWGDAWRRHMGQVDGARRWWK